MRTHRRGAHAVEFALILPVWFGVIAAIMDFGWMFYHVSMLDAAANIGCRAGAIVDPGDRDAHIGAVEARTMERMLEVLVTLGASDCDSCEVNAYTVGAPPARSLVCRVHEDVVPLTGLFFGTQQLTSVQVSRLEWQREAAAP